jgi:O-acetyl-ADP-ribose deacetylase (regulator of RNase III)
MIYYSKGTIFNTEAKTIVNTVNCEGVMGRGLALEFRLRYPSMYNNYIDNCKSKELRIGKPKLYKVSDDEWILNFPTKNSWKHPSKLEYIRSGLEYFRKNYERADINSIAFPKLGTNNGGLKWDTVHELMKEYLSDIDLDIYICLDELNYAEGKEKEMLSIINRVSKKDLTELIGLREKEANKIIKNRPMTRFWKIMNIKGIGIKSYEKIFDYCYNSDGYIKDNTEQLSFI